MLAHPPTSMLVAIGSGGRHDLTWPPVMGHQAQEGCPGWQDAREICFLRCPPKMNESLPSFHVPLSSGGRGSRGHGANVTRVVKLLPVLGIKHPIMHKGVGWGHSMTDTSLPPIPFCGRKVCTMSHVIMSNFLFPPPCLKLPHLSEFLHPKTSISP